MTKLRAVPVVAVLLSTIVVACSDASDATGPQPATRTAFSVAGPPLTGSGTGTITSLVITSQVAVGNNVIQERTLEGVLSGALEGTFAESVRGVIHGNGLITFQGTLEFAGTLAGCGEGTLTASFSGTGVAGAPTTDAFLRIINQSAGTIAAAGTGTQHQTGPNITYELRYVCDAGA